MFLKELYRQWKAMFFVVIAFMLAQAFFMFKAVETVPFFLFNMYSTPEQPRDTSYVTTLFINGKPFDQSNLIAREKETLMGSWSYFQRLKRSGFYATDTITIRDRFKSWMPPSLYEVVFRRLTNKDVTADQFLSWWTAYLARVTGQRVDHFSLLKSTVVRQPQYRILGDTVTYDHYVIRH